MPVRGSRDRADPHIPVQVERGLGLRRALHIIQAPAHRKHAHGDERGEANEANGEGDPLGCETVADHAAPLVGAFRFAVASTSGSLGG